MTLPSPISESTDLVTFSILVQGQPINASYQVLSVNVVKEVNRIPVARLQIIDGDPSEENFSIADSADFVPGNSIQINAGYESSNAVIFSGIIIKQGVKLHNGNVPLLVVECRDKAVKMTIGRKNAYFQNMMDSAVIQQIVGTYSLTCTVDSTGNTLEEIVQYYASDWDFILSRADINGLIVLTDQGTIAAKKIDTSPTPVLGIVYGDSMLKFDVEMDARTQLSSVQSSSWDYTSQAIIQATSQDPGLEVPGNISSSTLAGVTSPSNFLLQSSAPVEQPGLQNWANARIARSVMSKVRGTMSFQGSSLVNPGVMLGVEGLGARFDGNAFVCGVKHVIEDGNWITEATLGLPFDGFTETKDNIEAPVASGLLPGIQGLQIGVVTKIDSDPDNQFRVQVKIPIINATASSVWARLSSFYATNGAGSIFYPEIGDEVVLGFLNDDPRYPVILGSLYSSTRPPYTQYAPDAKNTNKAIVTNSKLIIDFDDVKKEITILTPAKNSLILSDDQKSITITDQNGNSVKLSESGIDMTSAKDINITAQGNVNIKSTADTTINATGNASTTGMVFSAKGNTSASVSGSTMAQFSSDGELVIKGTMVMIN